MGKLFFRHRELDYTTPLVMGILNLTPDSFFDGGRFQEGSDQLRQVEKMLRDGASIIDAGAVSTRPGSTEPDEETELQRLIPAIGSIMDHFPGCILSADTYRARVAREAVEAGVSMINDIYGGRYGSGMLETIAELDVPYILMHMKGTPATMQTAPSYTDVMAEISYFFENQLKKCREYGIRQVIIDPGFGFGKTPQQNFSLLSHLGEFKSLGYPLMAGISRKSMITGSLEVSSADALNGTTVLNTIALMKGADILRVHDVREAIEAVRLVGLADR